MTNEKTKWIFDEGDGKGGKAGGSGASDMTETLGGSGIEPTYAGSTDPTVQIPMGGDKSAAGADKTTIYSGRSDAKAPEAGFAEGTDPVVGWLVVVKGPGLGNAVPLGAGMNTIGRGPDARASLPFGDSMISGEDHIRIIYDDAERSFFIAHGAGKNISRVNGQLLANTLPLENDALIDVSKWTQLRFKQFCGPDFDWSEVDVSGSDAP